MRLHIRAHKISSGKGTKKNPYIQIYGDKSAKYFSFARKSEGFEEFGLKKDNRKQKNVLRGYRLRVTGYGV